MFHVIDKESPWAAVDIKLFVEKLITAGYRHLNVFIKSQRRFFAVFTKPDLSRKQPLIPKWLCDVRLIKETLSYNSISRSWKPKCFLFYIRLIYVQTYCRPTNQFLIFFLSNSKYPSANKPLKGRFCEILQICHDN